MLTLYIADAERDAGMKNLSRKEALEILNGMKVKIKIPKAAVMQNKRNAALDMAIEALKYSETPKSSERTSETAQPDHNADIGKKVCVDTISRQAALDTIMGQPPESHYPSWYAAQIEELPAVHPVNMVDAHAKNTPNSTSLGEKEGKPDLISRQTALDTLARMMPRSYTPDGSHPADEEIFRAQEVFADCIEALEILPSAAPSTAHTTETTAPSTDDWIPVERELPEDLAEVNVTWVNHEPEPYYEPIKSKPFTASAVYYEGNWYWYSSVCADVLAEYGRNDVDKVDDAIEITAWTPLPEPYRGGDSNE